MDNLFLIRYVIDVSINENCNVGFLSIDQEKAFDRVGHENIFKVLESFGFGKCFISWIQLLYKGASIMLKMGNGLTYPLPVKRGIRQGCPLSGQLYSLAIDPLLCKLRNGLKGFMVPGDPRESRCSVSAYADDVIIFVTEKEDMRILLKRLQLKSIGGKVMVLLWVSGKMLGQLHFQGVCIGEGKV